MNLLNFKLDELKTRITSEYAESLAMLDGDHWLDEKGFIGELPAPGTAKRTESIEKIRKGFVWQNVVEEIVSRRNNGILGRTPRFPLVDKQNQELNEAQIKVLTDLNLKLNSWFDQTDLQQLMLDANRRSMAQKTALIRFVRLPDLPRFRSTYEAFENIRFEVMSANAGGVFRDKETNKLFSVCVLDDEVEGEGEVEFSFVGDDGKTVLRVYKEKDFERLAGKEFTKRNFAASLDRYNQEGFLSRLFGDKTAEYIAYPPVNLNGHLYLYELTRPAPFITEAIKSKQKVINLAYTMMSRNINLAGNRERTLLNARPAGVKIKVADATAPEGFRYDFIEEPFKVGAGVVNTILGDYIRDEDGKIVGVANPNISYTDPVSVVSFENTIDINYRGILAEAEQLHVLQNDNANASGRSRQEARSEFEKSLKHEKTLIDPFGRFLIEVGFYLAGYYSRESFDNYKVDFNAIVDAGVPSPEEIASNTKEYETGGVSLKTRMSRNGVEDVEAELALIKAEDGYELNFLKTAGEAFTNFGGAISIQAIVALLPFEDDKKQIILDGLQTTQDVDLPNPLQLTDVNSNGN